MDPSLLAQYRNTYDSPDFQHFKSAVLDPSEVSNEDIAAVNLAALQAIMKSYTPDVNLSTEDRQLLGFGSVIQLAAIATPKKSKGSLTYLKPNVAEAKRDPKGGSSYALVIKEYESGDVVYGPRLEEKDSSVVDVVPSSDVNEFLIHFKKPGQYLVLAKYETAEGEVKAVIWHIDAYESKVFHQAYVNEEAELPHEDDPQVEYKWIITGIDSEMISQSGPALKHTFTQPGVYRARRFIGTEGTFVPSDKDLMVVVDERPKTGFWGFISRLLSLD